jgi:hypothetical protein
VISVNFYNGLSHTTLEKGVYVKATAEDYEWLRAYTPLRRIGGSFYYFRLDRLTSDQ